MKKILRKIFKTIAWCLFSIILLLILLVILIQIPAVQDFIKTKVVAYLENTLHTKVEIGKLSIDFPSGVSLEKIYLQDQHKDTLFACDSLAADIAMLKLISSNVAVSSVSIKGLVGNVHRLSPDTAFNFDYIIKAFSSSDTTAAKTAAPSSWKISLKDITLSNIRLKYTDDVLGYDVNFKLDRFYANVKTFDPFKAKYDIPQIQVTGIVSDIKQYAPKTILHMVATTDAVQSVPVDLALKKIGFHNIRFAYNDDTNKMLANLNLDTLGVMVDKIDLDKTNIKIQKVELNSAGAAVVYDKMQKQAGTVVSSKNSAITTAKTTPEWKIELAALALNNNSMKYDDNNYSKTKTGLDYHHIFINPFNLEASNLLMSNETYAGSLDKFSLKEQSGFVIKNLQTVFKYNDKEGFVKDLSLQTNNSRINSSLHATYSSTEDFTKNPEKVFAEANVDTCLIAVQDILLLQPALSSNLDGYKTSIVKFKGKAKGLLSDINIQEASFSGIGNTSIVLNGNIKGLTEAKSAYYNINIAKLVTAKKDILGFIPPSSMPSSMRIPESIKASGYFKGTTTAFNSKLDLNTSSGNAVIISKLNTKTEQFDVNATLNNADLGYILMQDSMLGKISMNAAASGKGFDYKKMIGLIDAEVSSAEINHYIYSGLLLNAKMDKGLVNIGSSVDDANLDARLTADADLSQKYPSVRMNLLLDTANLDALHFYNDTFGVKINLSADFSSTNPDSLAGNLLINHLTVYTAGRHLSTDLITLAASNQSAEQSLKMNADFVKASWTGQYKLTEVAPSIAYTLNHYYKMDNLKDSVFNPQQWSMNILLNPASKTVQSFLPELKGSDSITASVDYRSNDNHIHATVNGRSIHYAGNEIDSLFFVAGTKEDRLRYSLTASKAGTESFHLLNPSLNGFIKDDQLIVNAKTDDKRGDDLYRVSGTISKIPAGLRLNLNPDSLLLNHNKWDLSRDNFIDYDSAGLMVNNFFMSRDSQSLSIRSTSALDNAPLETNFKDFRIKTLTEFAGNDSLQLDGLVNGSVTLTNLKNNPLFTSDLKIGNLQYMNDTLGNLFARIFNLDEKTLQDSITLSGVNNDVQLSGKYFISNQQFNQHLVINQFGLHSFLNFSAGQLKEAGGNLKGDISITGQSDKLDIGGDMYFDSAFITPSMLGERLRLSNEKIVLDKEGVHFNQFTMRDSAGNKAILNGTIFKSEDRNYKFLLDLDANDFRVINSTKADNKDFYGKLNIDAGIKIRGDLQTPDINAGLRINKQTDLTVVLPDVNPEVQDREGVVNFIDPNHPADTSLVIEADTIPTFKMLAGLKLTTNIETDTSAQFAVVIDERNGDVLKVKGSADIATTVDENGKITLTGNYELQQGSYQITLSILKRKFDIVKGSTITWAGDPMQANIDITAAYFIKAPTIELMNDELTGKTDEEKNKYKERLPITVLLKMKGELLKPDISFDIMMPEDIRSKWDDVENKLKQLRTNETEMSKQVFGLLLLSRFVEEDPTVQSAGGTTEGLVRESVSGILSDQLNNLAGSLVKGVDLSVDLNSTEDYTSGSRQYQTDLTIGVSKTLLNDRLKVNVGSNFLLEGAYENQAASNIAGDIAVDYALSADGRYRVRAYRKNEYEGAVEGQIVESGLTFIITINYDRFKELFQKHKEEKKKDKE